MSTRASIGSGCMSIRCVSIYTYILYMRERERERERERDRERERERERQREVFIQASGCLQCLL